MIDPIELAADRDTLRAKDVARLALARVTGKDAAASSLLHVTGTFGAMTAMVARAIALAGDSLVVCVTADLESARRLSDDLAFFWGDRAGASGSMQREALVLSPNEASPYADSNPDRRAAAARLVALFYLAHRRPLRFLIVPAAGLVRKVIPRAEVERQSEVVTFEQEIDRDKLTARLASTGYLRVPVVEDPGSFAVRGAILDVWPPGAELPVRIELYGDLVVSLRSFDPDVQRTVSSSGAAALEQKEVWLPPAREVLLSEAAEARAREVVRGLCDAIDLPSSRARALLDDVLSGRPFFGSEGFLPAYYALEPLTAYVPDSAIVLLEDPPAIVRALREELVRAAADEAAKSGQPHMPIDALYESEPHVADWLSRRRVVALHRSAVAGSGERADLERFEAVPMTAPSLSSRDQSDLERSIVAARSRGKSGALEPLLLRLRAWREAGLTTVLAARTETQAERLVSLLRHRGEPCETRPGKFDARILEQPGVRGHTLVTVGPLARGAVAPAEGLALVTEEEIFGRRAHRAGKRATGRGSRPFSKTCAPSAWATTWFTSSMESASTWASSTRTSEKSPSICSSSSTRAATSSTCPSTGSTRSKSTRAAKGAPKLDRLGGQTFAKTKARVEKQVRQMADELLRLYAERKAMPGRCHSRPPTTTTARSRPRFPFDETPDQARAIDDVLPDLETPRADGPPGLRRRRLRQDRGGHPRRLPRGHSRAAGRRPLPDHGARAAALPLLPERAWRATRFASPRSRASRSKQGASRRRARPQGGQGRHRHRHAPAPVEGRALQAPRPPGRRRGAALRRHAQGAHQAAPRRNVDVLTLTATPIPRTLQMAVSGLRDMSLITTPPVDRRAIRTIVTRMDDARRARGDRRELARGGQVFYVYNRVEGIYERAAARAGARARGAHRGRRTGRWPRQRSSRRCSTSSKGATTCCAATAIIESGLDIPRANTIIIDRADIFGLAQLYQLRGRVGRSKERAYCYLVVPPPNAMTDEARARIEALERHTELGSGFKIASLDLELRGAGRPARRGAERQRGRRSASTSSARCSRRPCTSCAASRSCTKSTRSFRSTSPRSCPTTTSTTSACDSRFYKRFASADDDRGGHRSRRRNGRPLRTAARRSQAARSPHAHQDRAPQAARARVRGERAARSRCTSRADTPLDPTKLLALVGARGSPYRLTPDMRLTRKMTEHDVVADGLAATDKVLVELAPCVTAPN